MKKEILKAEYIRALESKFEKAKSSYEIAKKDTIEAEGRMVTRYDSTKTETAWLADGYLKEVKELANMINRLKTNIKTVNISDMVEVDVYEKEKFTGSKIFKLDMEMYKTENDLFLELLGTSVNDEIAHETEGRLIQYYVKKIKTGEGFEGVCLDSVVCLEDDDTEEEYYYLVNYQGGMEINVEGTDIFCISKNTPIATMLLGKSIGDVVKINENFVCKIEDIK